MSAVQQPPGGSASLDHVCPRSMDFINPRSTPAANIVESAAKAGENAIACTGTLLMPVGAQLRPPSADTNRPLVEYGEP